MEEKKIHQISNVKSIIKIVVFLLILSICINTVHNITKRKNSYQKTKEFFIQKKDFDVLFFGSSHTLNTMLPLELWNDYGIVSYNLGNPNETMPISYHNMQLALKETNPKLVVIDALACTFDKKIIENKETFLHESLDSYPISYKKYLAIKDLFDGKDIINKSFEYLWNFSLYHSRWNDIKKNDFNTTKTIGKGAGTIIKVAEPKKINDFDLIGMYSKQENINMQYLRKMIEYCQKEEIEILVTFIPFPASDYEIAISKYVKNICDEYNVNYINFLNMDVVDYYVDLANEGHLNTAGARKVTSYIGKYIIENYNMQDQRMNEIYDFWYQDYDEYIGYKIRNLAANKDNLNNYLMLLYGEKDIKYEIKISSKYEVKKGSTLYNLLLNLENNYKIDDSVFEQKTDKTIKITTWNNRNGSLIDTIWF